MKFTFDGFTISYSNLSKIYDTNYKTMSAYLAI